MSRYLIWCVYMRTIYAEYNINHDSIDVYTSAGYMLRIDCWKAEKNLKTTYGSECALTSLAVDEPLEYARLYLDGNLQMWVDAEDSREFDTLKSKKVPQSLEIGLFFCQIFIFII